MGTAFPPTGWSMVTGTWGVDADQGTGAIGTNPCSDFYLQLKNTSVATKLQTDTRTPIQAAKLYLAECYVQADSIAAGNTVTVNLMTGTSTILASPINGVVLSSTNTWIRYRSYIAIPATSAWWNVAKAAHAYNVFVGGVGLMRAPYSFSAREVGGGQAIAASTVTQMTFDTTDHNYGSQWGSNSFLVQEDGAYAFSACAIVGSMAANKEARVILVKNGGQIYSGAVNINGSGGARDVYAQGSWNGVSLVAGDFITLAVFHNDTVSRSILATSTGNFFMGHQILEG